MRNSPPRYAEPSPAVSLAELQKFGEGWLLAGSIDQHSDRTTGTRTDIIRKLVWFLRQREYAECGIDELRAFLAYVTTGHREPGGRWANPRMTAPVRPRTVKDYHGHLRAFFNWLVKERRLHESPMERIPVPVSRPDEIQPFTLDHIGALLAAAKRGRHPKRDEALLLFMFDTGVRASELCGLTVADVDISSYTATVHGKGNKKRPVSFQRTVAKALWTYLKEDERDPSDPLFLSERGEPLTRSGLLQLFERLGDAAGITGVRCSPHTMRHAAATEFLRGGGREFTLQLMLGHTSISQTKRYAQLAQADLAAQHRDHSPVERLKGRGRSR